jgi:flavin reductase (DIM6/NTAB) family NADH-FMN oxidoreductase RutF
VDDTAFHSLIGRLDHAMFIVTTVARGGEGSGCLIGFATQTSIGPPRFLACISDKNHTYRVARGASHLAVHLVPADRMDLAEVFGGETGDQEDKFAEVEWHEGPEGLPLLDACPTWFAGRILERLRLGDHVGHLLEPFAAEDAGESPWFPFSRAKGIHPGHEA